MVKARTGMPPGPGIGRIGMRSREEMAQRLARRQLREMDELEREFRAGHVTRREALRRLDRIVPPEFLPEEGQLDWALAKRTQELDHFFGMIGTVY